jgi:hypothetical protein
MLAAVALLAGCGGSGDTGAITREELPGLVLLEADLPAEWRAFDLGRQVQVDRVPGPRGDPARFDRIEGWKSRYRRPGTPETGGALVIESRADLFPSEQSARQDLDAYGAELDAEVEAAGGRRLEPPELGDEAVAATYVQPGSARVRSYRIAWRAANATASITVNGFDGKLSLAQALTLARKQQARLSRAAAS